MKGLDIVVWEERRWRGEGETFLLPDATEDKSSSEERGLGCPRFLFQFRLACRSLSSESSLSWAMELIVDSRLSTPYVLSLGDSRCFEGAEGEYELERDSSIVFSSARK